MQDPLMNDATFKEYLEQIEVREYTEEEAHEYFDAMARFHLNISGDEFRTRWHQGDYDDNPDRPGVITMAMLLPMVERQEVNQ
jgi:hypothetical protein